MSSEPDNRPSNQDIDLAWAQFLRDTSSNRTAWEAFKAGWNMSQFRPSGDNHHNAAACPYCSPVETGAVHPSPELPGETFSEADALHYFTEYFVANYPGPDTIIHNPKWHAPKLFKAALYAIRAASHRPAESSEKATEPQCEVTCFVRGHTHRCSHREGHRGLHYNVSVDYEWGPSQNGERTL